MGCSDSKDATAVLSIPEAQKPEDGSPTHGRSSVAQNPCKGTDNGDNSINKMQERSMAKRKCAITAAERMLALNAGQTFYDKYTRPNLVSYGASCKVMTAYHKATQVKVACKVIAKSTRNPVVQRLSVLNEIGIMKQVEDHPNAIHLREVFDTANSYYIVMDLCDGGELFEHITKSKETFTERDAAQILRSLMLFLAHMHSQGMAHMDVKPENIMFDSEGTKGVVKVLDFGASIHIQPEETVRDAFGTVRYSSPEMAADENIGQKTDVWSAGVVMYFMLCGSAPFLKKDEVDTLNYIKNKPKVKFSGSRWASISQQAKECISAMLEVEADLRPSAQEVLQMPWLRIQGPDTSIRIDILSHLRTFANQSRMRRLLLGLMAAKLSGSEANRLLNQFYSMDSDFSGTIEVQELALVTKQALPDLNPAEVERLFYALDLNKTGTVDVKEFFASLLHTMAPENQMEVARKSFIVLDKHHSGFITLDAFVETMVQQAITSGMDTKDAEGLVTELETEFRALDANSDGVLSFEEFRSVLGVDDDLHAWPPKMEDAQGKVSIKDVCFHDNVHLPGALVPESSGQQERSSIVRLALAFQGRQPSLDGRAASNAGNALPGFEDGPDTGNRTGTQGSRAQSVAAAAAAMTAAVAVTVATSTPRSDDGLECVELWPQDPAMAQKHVTTNGLMKNESMKQMGSSATHGSQGSNGGATPRQIHFEQSVVEYEMKTIPGQIQG